MNVKEAIESLYDYLSANASIPVQVSGTESRPVPAITIDDWNLEHKRLHNSRYVGSNWSENVENEKVYRHHYRLRIELLIRTADNVEAHNTLSDLQSDLIHLEENPSSIHSEVCKFELGDAGGITHQFNEPPEHELNQSVFLESFYESTDDSFGTLEDITLNLTHD